MELKITNEIEDNLLSISTDLAELKSLSRVLIDLCSGYSDTAQTEDLENLLYLLGTKIDTTTENFNKLQSSLGLG